MLTVMLVPEGGDDRRSFQVSYRTLRIAAAAATVLTLVVVAMVGTWWYLAARAMRTSELEEELARAQEAQSQVARLSRQLADLEERYEAVRHLFGSETGPIASDLWLPALGSSGGRAPSETAGEGPSLPTSWPLTQRGFVTQPLLEGSNGDHPGLDIAVPTDSYIRAAGGGTVARVGQDEVYGNFVVVDHVRGLSSLYAHASVILVSEGARVRRNEVIGLSGSTGRSTAPHLHFEILEDGEAVDPLDHLTLP
ncbi:MAG TPA: M23 family metallopeptidase [Longimicrobiales bacterium]|nr:M23 family metallopeptidase [Longimicrobiales bacterium]